MAQVDGVGGSSGVNSSSAAAQAAAQAEAEAKARAEAAARAAEQARQAAIAAQQAAQQAQQQLQAAKTKLNDPNVSDQEAIRISKQLPSLQSNADTTAQQATATAKNAKDLETKSISAMQNANSVAQTNGHPPPYNINTVQNSYNSDKFTATGQSQLPTQLQDPTTQANLAKIGIKPEDYKSLGAAMPKAVDAANALAGGNWQQALTDANDIFKSDPQLAGKIGGGVYNALPKDVQGKLGSMGITQQDFQQGAQAIPHAIQLAQDLGSNADPTKIANDVNDLYKAAPDLVNKVGDKIFSSLPHGLQDQLKSIGLDGKNFQEVVKAMPQALQLANDLKGKADPQTVINDINELQKAAPDTLNKIGNKIYDSLPFKDQLSKVGITKDNLAQAWNAVPSAMKLATDLGGKPPDLNAVYNDINGLQKAAPDLLNTIGKKVYDALPGGVKDALNKVGINDKNLKQAWNAIPDALKLANDLQGGPNAAPDVAKDLVALGNAAPDIFKGIGDKVFNALPKPLQDQLSSLGLNANDLKQAGAAVPKFLQLTQDIAAGKDPKTIIDDINGVKGAAPDLLNKVGSKLYDSLPTQFKDTLQKFGITAQNVSQAWDALPHAIDLAQHLKDGNIGAAIKDINAIGSAAPDLLKSVGDKLYSEIDKTSAGHAALQELNKLGINQQNIGEAWKALPDAMKAVDDLKNGKIDAVIGDINNIGKNAPNLLNSIGSNLYKQIDANPEGHKVLQTLNKLGINEQNIGEAWKAAPDAIKLAQDIGSGNIDGAITDINNIGKDAPNLLGKIGDSIYKQIDANPEGHKVLQTLDKFGINAQNIGEAWSALPHVLDAAKAFAKGDPASIEQGLQALGDAAKAAPDLLKSIGNAVYKELPKSVQDKLSSFGLTPDDFAGMIKAAPDAIHLIDDLTKSGGPDFGKAIQDFGKTVNDLPPDLRTKIGTKIADTLHLPPGLRDIVVNGANVLADPKIQQDIGNAVSAFKSGDIGKFVSSLADAGKTICNNKNEQGVAVDFLNNLSHLPGSLGKLFANKDLNQAVVTSGAAGNMFDAAEKLANGDVGGALQSLVGSIGDLIGQGDHFSAAGVTLPFGMQGIKNLTNLFGTFFDALPQGLKDKIGTEAAKFAGKSFLESIPILGNIASGIDAIGAGKSLIHDLGKKNKDWLQIAIDGAQTGLDVAGMVPGLNDITGPLQTVLGTVKVVKGASDLISNLGEYQHELAGF